MRNVLVAVIIGIILALGIWLSWQIRSRNNSAETTILEVADAVVDNNQQSVNVAGYNIQLNPNRNMLARIESEVSRVIPVVPTNTPVPQAPQANATATPIPPTRTAVPPTAAVPTRVIIATQASNQICNGVSTTAHTVSQGETLWGVADRYGTTVELMAECDIASGDMFPGNVIFVPVRNGNVTTQNVTCTTGSTRHTVAVGENVFRIGLRYGVDKDVIRNANNLNANYLIFPGDVLCIP